MRNILTEPDGLSPSVVEDNAAKPAFCPDIQSPLNWLHDEELGGILGRTAGRHAEFGSVGLGYIGNACEQDGSDRVHLDLLEPHVAVLVGVRGSGKSYTQGVLVEELACSGLQIGAVVVDRCGVFSGLRSPNPSEEDREKLAGAGVAVEGLSNLQVFTPGRTHEGLQPFRITVSGMTAEDWIQFWNLSPEGPQGSLVRDVLNEVRHGYRAVQEKMIPACVQYDLAEIECCLEACQKIQSRYKPATVRSLLQRISSSEALGLFARSGTSVKQLSVSGQVSVIDLSDSSVDDSCAAKVVGMVSRMILQARQDSVREGVEHIPVTWLVIDEAHLFVGDTIQNGSASDLISYCKLGRRPGCALVLGTQQPSAIHKGVLSQADIVIAHQLVLESDIATLKRIIPASRPDEIFGKADLLRSLPPGAAIVADKLTQQRPVIVQIRPRKTRHDGGSSLPSQLTAPVDCADQNMQPDETSTGVKVGTARRAVRKSGFSHPKSFGGHLNHRSETMKTTWKQKIRERIPFFDSALWKTAAVLLAVTAFLGGMQIASGWKSSPTDVGGLIETTRHAVATARKELPEIPDADRIEDPVSEALATAVTPVVREKALPKPERLIDKTPVSEPIVTVSAQPPTGDFQRASRAFKKNQETLSRLFKE